MKLNTVAGKTDKGRRLRARLVKISYYRAGRDEKGYATAIARTYTPYDYDVHMKIVPAKDKNSRYVSSIKFTDKDLNVLVNCSCPDYMFRWSWANHKAGVGEHVYDNGEPPDIRNPSYRYQLCKHLYALRQLVKQKHGI